MNNFHLQIQAFLKRHSGLFLNALFFVAVIFAVTSFQMRNMLPVADEAAPPLSGPLLGGGTFDIDAADGRPTIVYFFAPWCKFCAASSDNLTRLRRLRDEDSLAIIVVALQWQDRNEIQNYVDRHDLDLPVVLGDIRIEQDWRIQAFPTYYVLGSDRHIRRRDVGYSSQFGLWWRTFLVD